MMPESVIPDPEHMLAPEPASCNLHPATEQSPAPQPATFNLQPSTSRKRVGKIAQLPKIQRDLINRLLDDGSTYKIIEEDMAKQDVSLNAENISNWFQGGYQDYLQHGDWLAQMSALRENAGDFLQSDDLKFHQAIIQVAVTQIFKSLKAEKLNDDPANHTRMLNSLCRLSREALGLRKYENTCAQAKAQESRKLDPKRDLIEKERDLIWGQVQGVFGFKPDKQIGPTLPELFASQMAAANADPNASPSDPKPDPATPQAVPPAPGACLECAAVLPALL